jgi:hypothetical protein
VERAQGSAKSTCRASIKRKSGPLTRGRFVIDHSRHRQTKAAQTVGFNRRKLEDQRREAAEKEAANRRATDAQVLQDAERLITAWNERQAARMPMLFSLTIGPAIAARYSFLWVRCPACRTINAIDLRALSTVTTTRP